MDILKLILTAIIIIAVPGIIALIGGGNPLTLPNIILICFYGIHLYIFLRSFKSQNTKQWLYNLRPFRPINTLIQQAYPNEKAIISKKIVFDSFITVSKIGNLPFMFSYKINFPIPALLIETDKSYYVDRRLQQLLNNLIVGPLLVLGIYFIMGVFNVGTEFRDRLVSLFVFAIFLLASLEVFYSLFAQVNKVEVIKKEWISSEKKGKHLVILSGTIPKNSQLTLSKDAFINSGRISNHFKQVFYNIGI